MRGIANSDRMPPDSQRERDYRLRLIEKAEDLKQKLLILINAFNNGGVGNGSVDGEFFVGRTNP